jgi:hypothetical protein
MNAQSDTSALATFIAMMNDAIPGVAEGLPGDQNISDSDLLSRAVKDAFEHYPPELLGQLLAVLMHQAPEEMTAIVVKVVVEYLLAWTVWESPERLWRRPRMEEVLLRGGELPGTTSWAVSFSSLRPILQPT